MTKIDYLNPITKSSNLAENLSGSKSSYGSRIHPVSGKESFHTGLDYKAQIPTSIYSAAKGNILKTGYSDTYGKYIVVEHSNGQSTLYAHLSNNSLFKTGEAVNAGQKIGISGNTGVGTGPHLHFEVLTPEATKKISEIKSDNGPLGIKGSKYRENPLEADMSAPQPKINSENSILNSDKNENYINSELGDLLSQSSVDQDNPNSSPSENPTTQSENSPQEEVSVDAVKDMLATEDMKQTADFMSEVKLQLPSMMGVMVARLALGEDIELVSRRIWLRD